jgi:hypothetical protein
MNYTNLHREKIQTFIILVAMTAVGGVAKADMLYSNGAPTGRDGWVIQGGDAVEDSFTLSSMSDLTGITFGNWLVSGDSATTVEWEIVGAEGSQTPACAECAGTGMLTAAGTFTVAFAPDELQGVIQSFSLPNLELGAGTYWLELQNEVTSSGRVGFWDMSGGPSQIWQNSSGDQSGSACVDGPGECSDSFTILGETTTVPEPNSAFLLIGGLLFVGIMGRRRVHLKASGLGD